jgi:CubicO group peptidase (beta-lactamase class C family)
MTAGEIIPKVTGKTWAAFLKEKIFTPLEMNNTLALSSEIEKATNKATAHTVAQGVLKKIPYGELDNLCAAGSISSSIHDMSHWLLMQLSYGMYNNQQVIPAAAITETRKPHAILGNAGHPFNKTNFALYGLGWFLQDYNGHKIVAHTGGVNGFVTGVTLLPDEKLGIVVLTNTDANNFFEALKWEILDAYLGLPYRNYSNMMLTGNKQHEQQEAKWLKQKQDTVAMHLATDLPLTAFAGNYEHEVYGKMTIAIENGKLVARFQHHHALLVTLEPLGKNRFLATFSESLYGIKAWPFTIENGKVKSVTVTMADFVEFTPYEFYKK